MAEALLRHLDAERFEALSAGSFPAGYVHPLVHAAGEEWGVPIENQHSKSWDDFADASVDVVITVCDAAAQETCPTWPGAPLSAHWPLPDPSFHPGSEEEQMQYALAVFSRLRTKIEALVRIDFDKGSPAELKAQLDRIAEA
ncbi:MAG: arsenate reductase ArsC [bacterium]|nr:arsenate reductase ArsC [bacterium]